MTDSVEDSEQHFRKTVASWLFTRKVAGSVPYLVPHCSEVTTASPQLFWLNKGAIIRAAQYWHYTNFKIACWRTFYLLWVSPVSQKWVSLRVDTAAERVSPQLSKDLSNNWHEHMSHGQSPGDSNPDHAALSAILRYQVRLPHLELC